MDLNPNICVDCNIKECEGCWKYDTLVRMYVERWNYRQNKKKEIHNERNITKSDN